MARRSRNERLGVGTGIRVCSHAGGDDGVGELLDAIAAAGEAGRAPKPGYGALSVERCYQRLCCWLVSVELAVEHDDGTADLSRIEAVAPHDLHGRPLFPSVVVAAWAAHLCATTDAQPGSIITYTTRAVKRLHADGWATNHLNGRNADGKAIRGMTKSLLADQQPRATRRARPAMIGDLGNLVAAVDKNRWNWVELSVVATRTWILLTWSISFRAGESIYRLRWGMLDLTPGDERVIVPARRLKTNTNELDLPIPHHYDCGASDGCVSDCPVGQLHLWRGVCERHGVPTVPEALVFPSMRNHEPGTLRSLPEANLQIKFGDRTWIADPIGEATAAAGNKHRDVAEGRAHESMFAEYMKRWYRVAKEAGFSPRSKFETNGGHGLRRGSAQQAVANGASVVEVQQRLGHANIEMTGVYLDPELEDTTTLIAGIDPKVVKRFNSLPADAEARADRCLVEHRGERCDRAALTRISVDDVILTACTVHVDRLAAGKIGDDFTAPARRAVPAGAACDVVHSDGLVCGSQTAVRWGSLDGTPTIICAAHAHRLAVGKTNDEFTAPIGVRRKVPDGSACQVDHHGTLCGRMGHLLSTVIDGCEIIVCKAHYYRNRKGKSGDDFTAPFPKAAAKRIA